MNEYKFIGKPANVEMMRNIVSGLAHNISHIYVDGGMVGSNPTTVGAAWAIVLVDRNDTVVLEFSGAILATPERPITNNVIEQIALTLALECMPDKWSGTICSDSQNAIGRQFYGWQLNGLPRNVIERGHNALKRLGQIKPEPIKGHPSKRELSRGKNSYGTRVSKHNVRADELCTAICHEITDREPKTRSVSQPKLNLGGDIVDKLMPFLAVLLYAPQRKSRPTPEQMLSKEPSTYIGQAMEVFNFWKDANKKKTNVSPKITKMIIDRIKEGYTVVQLCQASIGILFSPHHQGKNNNGMNGQGIKYNEPRYVFGDSEKVSRWIDKAEENRYSEQYVEQMLMPPFRNTGKVLLRQEATIVNKMTGEAMK